MKKGFSFHKKSIALLLVALILWGIDNSNISLNFFKKSTAVTQTTAKETVSEETKLQKLGFEKVLVSRVIDGDTFVLSDDRKVRLIGVNCPEDTTTKELCGDVATSFTKDQVENKYVYLEKDSSDTDKYGRLLRNVWLQIPSEINESEFANKSLCAILIEKGLAKPMTISPDTKYSGIFKSLAKKAKDSGKGMWTLSKEGTTRGDNI